MAQLTWQNSNSFDEWREVSGILRTSLTTSGVEITKSVDATATFSNGTTLSELWRRVVKIGDGFYAEFYNWRGALMDKKNAIFSVTGTSVYSRPSDFLSLAPGGSTSGGYSGPEVRLRVLTLPDDGSGGNGQGAYGLISEYFVPLEDRSEGYRVGTGDDARFGAPELYVAVAMPPVAGGTFSISPGNGEWPIPSLTALPSAFVSGTRQASVSVYNGDASFSVSTGGMFQASFTNPTLMPSCAVVTLSASPSGAWINLLPSTTYLRIAPSVDANGELVNPTKFVALPLVSTLIVGDGILVAACIPVDGVPGSGCFVVAGEIAPLNANAEAYKLAILRKAPVLWGTADTRTRTMTAHTVGNQSGAQQEYTMDYWRGEPPVGSDARTGGIVVAPPFLFGSGVAAELRGSFDAIEFCHSSVSRGATAWKGSKRYLCVDQGLLIRVV